MLKVRTEPGGEEGKGSGGGGYEGDSPRATAGEGGGYVVGRIGANQCVIALATSGDWLQVGRPRRGGGAEGWGLTARYATYGVFQSRVNPFERAIMASTWCLSISTRRSCENDDEEANISLVKEQKSSW